MSARPREGPAHQRPHPSAVLGQSFPRKVMSSDWKRHYFMWRKDTEQEFRWLGVCYFPGPSDSLLLAHV